MDALKTWWDNLPYPTKGAIARALRAGAAVTVGILLTAAAAGVLFPPTWSPIIVIAITTILQGIDKYLRERDNIDTGDTPAG